MDFYASKNPDNPIDDVFLTGDGALIRGIDGLFKIQLNVSTRIMDSLYNVKFDPSIDLRIYSPVYLIAPIGGALNPMGFSLGTTGSKSVSSGSLAPFIAVPIVCGLVAAGLCFFFITKENQLKNDKAALERQIQEKEYIEEIIAERDEAEAKATDVDAMYSSTYRLNEQALEFINELESKTPTNINVLSFTAGTESISIPGVASSYDDIADFIMNLKTIKCIDDVYVSSIAQTLEYGAGATNASDGEQSFNFTLTCVYTNPDASATDAEEE